MNWVLWNLDFGHEITSLVFSENDRVALTKLIILTQVIKQASQNQVWVSTSVSLRQKAFPYVKAVHKIAYQFTTQMIFNTISLSANYMPFKQSQSGKRQKTMEI